MEPSMEILAEEIREGYVCRYVEFSSELSERVKAYLLVPDGAADAERYPAVLMLHDHGARFDIGKEKLVRPMAKVLPYGEQDHIAVSSRQWRDKYFDGVYLADSLAASGYVVLVSDALYWGERSSAEAHRWSELNYAQPEHRTLESDRCLDDKSRKAAIMSLKAAVYEGQEIAGHGLYHSALDSIGNPLAMYEVCEDKRQLEAITGKPLKMFAYPFGTYNDDVIDILRLAGYQGARTVISTHDFKIPENFLVWNPTCHHDDEKLMELADKFLNGFAFGPQLFYVWGHAYEFDGRKNWDKMDAFLQHISGHEDSVWYATNGEIIDYVNAYRRLEYSVDGSVIYNPSAVDVTIRTAWTAVVLPAGSYTKIEDTPL